MIEFLYVEEELKWLSWDEYSEGMIGGKDIVWSVEYVVEDGEMKSVWE